MVRPAFSGISEDLRDLFPVKRIKRLQIVHHPLKIGMPWYLFTF